MKRILAAIFVAVLLCTPSFADYNEYATYTVKAATYTTIATNPTQLISGNPPVGYEGTVGEYLTVKTTRPLPVTLVNATVTVSLSSITTELGAGTKTIGSIGAIVSPLPAGTSTIGSVTVIGITNPLPAGTNLLGSVKAELSTDSIGLLNALASLTMRPGGFATEPVSVGIVSSTITLATPGPSGYATDPQYVTFGSTSFTAVLANSATQPVYVYQADGVYMDSSAVSTYTLLSSSAVTLFTTLYPVATAPCWVNLQGSSKYHWGYIGVASADLQWHNFKNVGEDLNFRLQSTSTLPLQFIGDGTTGPATLAIKIIPVR